MKKCLLMWAACFVLSVAVVAQSADGVGIGTTSVAEDAIFEVLSSDKGVLIPRVNNVTDVTNPASEGLLVYDNGQNGLFFYNGSAWQSVGPPKGTIIMWSGSPEAIPEGWALCNGSNGSPDLRGRFVVGYSGGGDYASVGNRGGKTEVKLTSSESGLPAHSHSINHKHSVADPGHTHNQYIHGKKQAEAGNGDKVATNSPESTAYTAVTTSVTGISIPNYTGNSGENTAADAATAHENRPPYYVLAFLIKL